MDKTKNLKKLNLSWCNKYPNAIYDSKLEAFLNGAKNTLTHLYIDWERFYPKKPLIKAIFASKELLELHLRNADLCPVRDYSKWIKADIIQCKNLQKLDLSFSVIKDGELLTIISELRNLKHLILDSVKFFDPNHSYYHINYLQNILEKLAEFNINLETWSSWQIMGLGTHVACRILSLFEFHTNLEELALSECHHTDEHDSFNFNKNSFNFFAKCSRLKRLSLAGWRNIEDIHLTLVTENCKKLEQVNISELQWITANSIKGLLKLENLKFLYITGCRHETISLSQIKKWRKEYPQVKIIT